MPFPYSYYQEFFDGPIHGKSFKGEALFIKSPIQAITSGTEIDVSNNSVGNSHVYIDTTYSNLTFNGITGGSDGLVLFVYKTSTNNKLTIKHNGTSGDKVYMANQQDLVLGAGQFGGAILICRNDGGVNKWFQLDSNGLLADGTAAFPSLSFASDPNTGIFRSAEDKLSVSTNGLERIRIQNDSIVSFLKFFFPDGSVSNPSISFSSETGTGFFKDADGLAISILGQEALRVKADKSLKINGKLRSSTGFSFLDESEVPQQSFMGSLLVSDLSTDSSEVPVDGIYSKGSVKSSGYFEGTATSAQFADLAERYEADKVYPAGTLVKIGGEKEITETTELMDKEVFGIISSKPAFKMNDNKRDSLNPFVALAGRVPCRITGKIKKGQRVIPSEIPGVGKALKSLELISSATPFYIVGRALESKETVGEGLVEVAIGGLP